MFRIYLSDVGVKNETRDFEVNADTLVRAESLAVLECLIVTGSRSVHLDYIDDLDYAVMTNEGIAGIVKIRSLGEG